MKVVFLDSMTVGKDVDLSPFYQLGEFIVYEMSDAKEAAERVKDADVIIANKVLMNEACLKDAPGVKLIALTATGYNNVDFEYVKKRGIAVTNVAGYSTDSVVQHTFALLFQVMEKMDYYTRYVRSGEYMKSPMFCDLGRTFYELKGKTWGIIGLGAIGRGVARVAEAFGCQVIYYSTSRKNNSSDYEQVSMDELLARADVVSVHAPLTEQTRGLMNYEAFCKMKRNAFFVNVGRGPIVEEAGLVRALQENRFGGAALDVISAEPMRPDNPLFSLREDERLVITPHVAWGTFEARSRLMKEVYENIVCFFSGEIRNRVC